MSELLPGQSQTTEAVKPNETNPCTGVPSADPMDAVREDCRRQRAQLLRQWDTLAEQTIADYELATLDVRQQMSDAKAEARRKIADSMQPLTEEADARRINVLQKYDTIKTQPATWKQNDDQAIGNALSDVKAAMKPMHDTLRRRSIQIPEPVDEEAACTRLSLASPDSVKRSIKVMKHLAGLAQRVHEEHRPGFLGVLVDTYCLPVGGILLGAATALALYFQVTPSLLVAGVTLTLLAAVGIGGHFLLAAPLRSQAKEYASRVHDLASAAEHAAQKGLSMSASIHRLEADDLARQRDEKLKAIDDWLTNEEDLRRQSESEHHAAAMQIFEERLDQLDVDFAVRLSLVEEEMRAKADALAEQISRRLTAG